MMKVTQRNVFWPSVSRWETQCEGTIHGIGRSHILCQNQVGEHCFGEDEVHVGFYM